MDSGCISLNKKGENAPGAALCVLQRIPTQMLVDTPLEKNNFSISIILKELAEFDIKISMGLAVVEQDEIFAQFAHSMIFGGGGVHNHLKYRGVDILRSILFDFVEFFFPLVFFLADEVCLLAHLIVAICGFGQLGLHSYLNQVGRRYRDDGVLQNA